MSHELSTKFTDKKIYFLAGDTETITFTANNKDSSGTITGPFDLTNGGGTHYDVVFTVKRDSEEGDNVFTPIDINDTDNGSDFANGIVVVKVDPALTNITPDRARYSLVATLSGDIKTLARGPVIMSRKP